MLLLVEIAVAVAVVFAVAALVVGRLDGLGDAPRDGAEPTLPAGRLLPGDVDETRFGLVIRGYRMAEVDDVLDRLAEELTARDGELALRERDLGGLRARVDDLEAELARLRESAVEMPRAPKPYVTTSFPPIREEPVGGPGSAAEAEVPPGPEAEPEPEAEPDSGTGPPVPDGPSSPRQEG